jgi:hypothetical protein
MHVLRDAIVMSPQAASVGAKAWTTGARRQALCNDHLFYTRRATQRYCKLGVTGPNRLAECDFASTTGFNAT